MVARLLRLRLTLLAAEFRGSFSRGLRTTATLIVAFAAAVALAWLPELLYADTGERAMLDIIVGALVLGAVFVVPLFENRGHLEPRQFVQYPVGQGSVAFALLITTVLSWPFLVLLTWLVALGVFRSEWQVAPAVVPLVLALAALLAMVSARVSSALSKLVVGPERAGVVRAIGVVLLIASLPVAVFVATSLFGASSAASSEDAAAALGWTPFGAPFAGLSLLAQGDQTAAMLRFAVTFGSVLVLLIAWFPIVGVSNERIDRPLNPAAARRGLGWFERFAARPSQVIGARALTYWARDPRYRVALIAIPFAPIVMILAFWVAGAELRSLALIPLPVILLLLGWSLHNDVAMDSTAIWSHVSSGIRGREDRLGRLAPVMLIGIPLVLIGSSITVTILGDWRVLPAVVGLNIAVLLIACGVSSIFSALSPYPSTRPGDSPFVQPQWSGSGSGLAQTLSILCSIVLAIPPAWLSLSAILDIEFVINLWALAFGAGYGVLVLLLGVLIGGRIFDRRGPELIAITQIFD